MRNLGAHAALALAGIIAGLPVAAVVQWNRDPPGFVWSTCGCGPFNDDDLEIRGPWSPRHLFATARGAHRITSIHRDRYIISGYWSAVEARPHSLRSVGIALLPRSDDGAYRVTDDPVCRVTADGVTWHRLRVTRSDD